MSGNYKTVTMSENDSVIIDIDDNVFYMTMRSIEWQSTPSSSGAILIETLDSLGKWHLVSAGAIDLSKDLRQPNPTHSGELITRIRITSLGLDVGSRFSLSLITRYDSPITNRMAVPSADGGVGITTQGLDYRDDLVGRGYGFYSTWEHSDEVGGDPVPAGAKRYAEFTSPSNSYFALSFREVITNKERVFYRVYTNYPAVTLGASIRIGNLKAGSSITAGSSFNFVNETVIDLSGATRVTNVPVFGAVNAGNRATGSLDADTVFRLIPPNTSFLLEFDNQSTSDTYAQVELVWAEIPSNLILDGGLA